MIENDPSSDMPNIDPNDIEGSREAFQKYISYLRASGHSVFSEAGNETHEGQAAINILNGLPSDASSQGVNGSFNDWLNDLLPQDRRPVIRSCPKEWCS